MFATKLRAVVATNRITQAVVSKETESLWYVFGLGVIISAAVSALQEASETFPRLYKLIYAVANTADSSGAIIGETLKLKNQGKQLMEAIRAMVFPTGIVAASWGLSPIIDWLFNQEANFAAASLYGVESATCTLPSLAGAWQQRHDYLKLAKEGKVDDPLLGQLLQKAGPDLAEKIEIFWLSLAQTLKHDLIYPHHAGFYIGALVGLLGSIAAGSISVADGQSLLQYRFLIGPVGVNFVLGPLGIADSIGGAGFNLAKDAIYRMGLRRDLHRLQLT